MYKLRSSLIRVVNRVYFRRCSHFINKMPEIKNEVTQKVLTTRAEAPYGNLPLMTPEGEAPISFFELSKICPEDDGKQIYLRTRLQNCRAKANNAFLELRQSYHTIQGVLFKGGEVSKEMIKFVAGVPNESVIEILGELKSVSSPIKSCSVKNMELSIQKFYVVSRSSNVLPFQMEDANRPRTIDNKESDDVTDSSGATVGLSTRLNNRVLDMRTPANQAIFRIQSSVCRFFREFFYERDFVEIHTPKLLAGSSEGGSNVFNFDYFSRKGCLAQSPQLYKQMMVMGDFNKVIEIGPVFRAENANTHRHLCEFTGLDMEMEINQSYMEVLDMISGVFYSIFKRLRSEASKELDIISQYYPFEEFLLPEKPVILDFKTGIKMLNDAGIDQKVDEDLSTPTEKALGKLVREKYKTDFYILHQYPESARPFYTMPLPGNPGYTCSYDVFIRGEEIISGAQRIHDPELLKIRALAKGMEPESIKDYISSFSLGAKPHGGFGVGLERVVMLYCDLKNVRRTSAFPRDPQRLTP